MNTDKIIAESIAKDYAPKENSKVKALKKLDNKAKLPATVFTYTCGIISALVFGTGMCLAMQVIGSGAAGMYLHPYLTFIKENRRLFSAVLSQPVTFQFEHIFERLFDNIFNPILDRFHYPAGEGKYVMMFYLNGLTAIITEWLKDGCEKEIAEIEEVIRYCIFGSEDQWHITPPYT